VGKNEGKKVAGKPRRKGVDDSEILKEYGVRE